MPKIVKNGKEYSGVPIEVVTAWQPTSDPVQVKEPLMGNTDISSIGNGTVTGAISNINSGLSWIMPLLMNGKVVFKDINGTGFSNVLQDVVANAGNLTDTTIFIGTHYASGQRGYIAQVYASKLYGACIYFEYSGACKMQYLNNGAYSTKDL